ncbi:MAG: hypothetical protein V4736_07900 [Bdellovibrionota bacterium]
MKIIILSICLFSSVASFAKAPKKRAPSNAFGSFTLEGDQAKAIFDEMTKAKFYFNDSGKGPAATSHVLCRKTNASETAAESYSCKFQGNDSY